MSVTFAGLTGSPVGRVPVVAGDAGVAVLAGCQVLTLLADTFIDAFAVSVTLAGWTLDEGPVIAVTGIAQAEVQDGLGVYPRNS